MPASQNAAETAFEALVVDDSPIDRALFSLLSKQLRASVRVAEHGVAALAAIAERQPDIVLTDLQMPEMDGLALVQAIRREYPLVPTILMTAHGSEEIALAALRQGAASYVNKRNLARRIAETVQDVLSVAHGTRQQLRLHECWGATDFEFELDNDPTLIPVLVNHLQSYQSSVRRRDEAELVHVGVALHEALRNAIHHGNLELSSALRHQDPETYYRLAEQRRQGEPYCRRRVSLRARESRLESRYIISDDGPGFDIRGFSYDPTDASNLDKPTGRGLFLIRTFMDEVTFNPRGNEITMVHRRELATGAPIARAPPGDNVSTLTLKLLTNTGPIVRFEAIGKITRDGWASQQEPLANLFGDGIYKQQCLLSLNQALYIDSTGVEWLLTAHKRFAEQGGLLILHSPNAATRQLLKVMRMDLVLSIVDDEPAALALASRKEPSRALQC